ncbi:hypothetical protein ACFDR9_004545 [Janthinobacterium sp. CG_23.3]|uniref:right-handed parallel beta-helix repeat-containing protein n=1 Tax=unclassified Janthinobacterium TaxID=2610881 RepID=UPI00034D062A|nr:MULTISPECIES: right-handed parallel beta-helix repeat-containing protein [unclassified Janthinobacterium]MEC5161199.1 hypothetical protein [Janthinobacterium sp. CG_S6]
MKANEAQHFPGRVLLRCALAALCGGGGAVASHAHAGARQAPPLLVYTDIVSGPNDGGENNKGIYLSLFGKNWGNVGLGSALKVFIGGVEVDNYRSLGRARGRPDIQQLTVQIGALGKPRPGAALPLKVVLNGVASNDNLTFTVNPGRILFVDNVNGKDMTAVAGDIRRPFRHVQTARLDQAAWGQAGAGDFIVLRGTGTAWTDRGHDGYFLRVRDKSGTAPTGAPRSGPIGLMGYPGEDVYIYQAYQADARNNPPKGAISAINAQEYPGLGQWLSVSNLRIEAGGPAGAINLQILGSHWRIVNNELSAATAVGNSDAKAGGIVGNGFGQVWLGNHIHDVYCGPANRGPLQNHGIYIDGDGDYEIAYNVIENIPGGSGFQTYANGSNGSDTTGNINFHHNLIRGVGKHGINLADGSRERINIFNNIVADTRYAGLRFNSTQLRQARIYNNTFYHTNTEGKAGYAAIMNDWHLPAHAIDLQNNLVVPSPGTDYTGGSVGFALSAGVVNRNFWFGGKGDTGLDAYPQTGAHGFAAAGRDFHLRPDSWAVDAGSAAVAGLVTNDYDISTPRPQGLGFDIGAYELAR